MNKMDAGEKKLLREIVRDIKQHGFATVQEITDKPIKIDDVTYSGSKAWIIILKDPVK